MAMSRSSGSPSLTSRSPVSISPLMIVSCPATIHDAVDCRCRTPDDHEELALVDIEAEAGNLDVRPESASRSRRGSLRSASGMLLRRRACHLREHLGEKGRLNRVPEIGRQRCTRTEPEETIVASNSEPAPAERPPRLIDPLPEVAAGFS
jgi:hypothetical protein